MVHDVTFLFNRTNSENSFLLFFGFSSITVSSARAFFVSLPHSPRPPFSSSVGKFCARIDAALKMPCPPPSSFVAIYFAGSQTREHREQSVLPLVSSCDFFAARLRLGCHLGTFWYLAAPVCASRVSLRFRVRCFYVSFFAEILKHPLQPAAVAYMVFRVYGDRVHCSSASRNFHTHSGYRFRPGSVQVNHTRSFYSCNAPPPHSRL